MNHSHHAPQPRSAMEQALERTIELSAGTKHYPISDGTLVAEHHRSYRYAFTVEKEWDVADGTDLTLTCDDTESPLLVELTDFTDTEVEFVVPQRLSEPTLTSATLTVERAYLLRKMKDGLASISTSAHLAQKLFGVEDSADEAASDVLVETIRQSFVPDEAQHAALLRSLASELLLIFSIIPDRAHGQAYLLERKIPHGCQAFAYMAHMLIHVEPGIF